MSVVGGGNWSIETAEQRQERTDMARELERLRGETSRLAETLRDQERRIEAMVRERDAYKRDYDAELAGAETLRGILGARADEGMHGAVERVVRERDEARASRDELGRELANVDPFADCDVIATLAAMVRRCAREVGEPKLRRAIEEDLAAVLEGSEG